MYFCFEKRNARRFRQAFVLALFRGDFCPFSLLCGVFQSRVVCRYRLAGFGESACFRAQKKHPFPLLKTGEVCYVIQLSLLAQAQEQLVQVLCGFILCQQSVAPFHQRTDEKPQLKIIYLDFNLLHRHTPSSRPPPHGCGCCSSVPPIPFDSQPSAAQ